jgi:hypothetical protein
VSLVGVLNVALALEDPFDNVGMGGVYVDEALYDVEQVGGGCPFLRVCSLAGSDGGSLLVCSMAGLTWVRFGLR